MRVIGMRHDGWSSVVCLEEFSDVIPNTGFLRADTGNGSLAKSQFRSRKSRIPSVKPGIRVSLKVAPSRGLLLSDWVGKVLGKPSAESPDDCNDPIAIPIDVNDMTQLKLDRSVSKMRQALVSTIEWLSSSGKSRTSSFRPSRHLLSSLVAQLETGSQCSARGARSHQRQIEDSRKRLAKLEERELDVLGKMKSFGTRSSLLMLSWQKQRARAKSDRRTTNQPGNNTCEWRWNQPLRPMSFKW